ncbi:MAG: (2Fe-2S)-binding protein [Betaproteobacteria bacterium]|nr:(2Fe-2S)-binding protein [Betaproteobacteria bacterium]
MQRRDFMRLCAAGIAAGADRGFGAQGAQGGPEATAHMYARTKLVDPQGKPLRAAQVPAQTNLIFHFPFATTPCFLLNLGRPADKEVKLKTAQKQSYDWHGGVGPGRSIVAYSAICAHQLAYPTREISFISYRAERSAPNKHAQVIHCCAEHSQYDPAQGGRVVAGPAPQPLAAILLEHDAKTDELAAVGTLGGEMFNAFFAKYAFKLSLEHGGAVRETVRGTAVVSPLDNYCRQQVRC